MAASLIRRGGWKDIASQDYARAFEELGGSFSVHPRVVALISALVGLPVRYVGLDQGGRLVAALPLWGEHVVGTRAALEFHRAASLMDFGEPEVVLPIARDARIRAPFIADMLSDLHADNIEGLQRERFSTLTLAKGIRTGVHRFSGRNVKNLRRKVRNLQETGATFEPVTRFSPSEVVAIFSRLHACRWGAPPPADGHLSTVVAELHDMLAGDVLLIGGQPAAFEFTYSHATPLWLFANGVQAGWDPAFADHAPGSLILYHNLDKFEQAAIAAGKELRYSFGWNNQSYKSLWTYETTGYRCGLVRSYLAKARTLWWLRSRPAPPSPKG